MDFTTIKPGDDLWLTREHVEGLLAEIEALKHDISRHLEICSHQAEEISNLRLQTAGLEAMLCDAQQEIADLRARIS